MVRKIKRFVFLFVLFLQVVSCVSNRSPDAPWEIKKSTKNPDSVSWMKFQWTNETLSGKYYERVAMSITCLVDGIENPVTFQFDLGSNLSVVYENPLQVLCENHPMLRKKVSPIASPLMFWKKEKCVEQFILHSGDYSIVHPAVFIYKETGSTDAILNTFDTVHLGSLGADVFQNNVLIIDYPHERFAICNEVPPGFETQWTDITLDRFGRVVLPMKIRDKNLNIQFDNGSSLFPLIALEKNIPLFSTLPDEDTIRISSWGKWHDVTGRMITDTFELAGKKYSHVKVYANHTGLGIDKSTDGMAGNALFWNNILVIDFKHKKAGVK